MLSHGLGQTLAWHGNKGIAKLRVPARGGLLAVDQPAGQPHVRLPPPSHSHVCNLPVQHMSFPTPPTNALICSHEIRKRKFAYNFFSGSL
jgi:hypothetical protein